MATFQNPSGQSDYTETRDNIITRALRICSVIADEEIPTSSMLAGANQALNALVKQWDSLGIHIWTETEGVIFLQPNQYKYELNPRLATPPNDNAAENWRLSNITSPMGQGDTVVTLGTIYDYGLRDIVIGDKIGIVLDTGQVYWALVAFPDPLTLDVAMPSSASGNNAVFLYRDRVVQPLRVVSARRFILSNRIETPLLTMSRIDYREMPNKNTPGTITSFFYDPQLISGFFWTWPSPSDVTSIVLMTFYRRIQDFVDGMNTPDLPQEWTNALTWNLAKELGPEYDIPLQKYTNMVLPRAAETLEMVQGFDREPEPTYLESVFLPQVVDFKRGLMMTKTILFILGMILSFPAYSGTPALDLKTHDACLAHRDSAGVYADGWTNCTAFEASYATAQATRAAAAAPAYAAAIAARDAAAQARLGQ